MVVVVVVGCGEVVVVGLSACLLLNGQSLAAIYGAGLLAPVIDPRQLLFPLCGVSKRSK